MVARSRSTDGRQAAKLASVTRLVVSAIFALALAIGGYAYWLSTSIWLALFVLLVALHFMGAIPKILLHDRRVPATIVHLLWPVGGTATLWLVYSQWGIMWIAVLAGVVGGLIAAAVIGALFFRDFATEYQGREATYSDLLDKTSPVSEPEVDTMKGRFSSSDWDEIWTLPEAVFLAVASADGAIKAAEIVFWAAVIVEADMQPDPLLRAMLIDQRAKLQKMAGSDDPVEWVSWLISNKRLQEHSDASPSTQEGFAFGAAFDMSAGKYSPHALQILRNELSQDELRHFMNWLYQYGTRIANADGEATPDEMMVLMQLVRLVSRSREDLLAMLGVEKSDQG